MSTLQLPDTLVPAVPTFRMRRFTVAEYHKLARSGALPDGAPFELLEGWIVPKMTRNPPHDVALDKTHDAIRAKLPPGWRIRVQSAITTLDSEPEPDLAVVLGPADRYGSSHPVPTDIAFLVEVADSSLDEDQGAKARIYARANIAVYWIVNLVDRQVEVYTMPLSAAAQPSFGQVVEFRGDKEVPLMIGGQQVALVPVSEMLPATHQ